MLAAFGATKHSTNGTSMTIHCSNIYTSHRLACLLWNRKRERTPRLSPADVALKHLLPIPSSIYTSKTSLQRRLFHLRASHRNSPREYHAFPSNQSIQRLLDINIEPITPITLPTIPLPYESSSHRPTTTITPPMIPSQRSTTHITPPTTPPPAYTSRSPPSRNSRISRHESHTSQYTTSTACSGARQDHTSVLPTKPSNRKSRPSPLPSKILVNSPPKSPIMSPLSSRLANSSDSRLISRPNSSQSASAMSHLNFDFYLSRPTSYLTVAYTPHRYGMEAKLHYRQCLRRAGSHTRLPYNPSLWFSLSILVVH